MTHRVHFSESVIQGIRDIARRSYGPADLEKTVTKAYGPSAVEIALEIAAELHGPLWLKETTTSAKDHSQYDSRLAYDSTTSPSKNVLLKPKSDKSPLELTGSTSVVSEVCGKKSLAQPTSVLANIGPGGKAWLVNLLKKHHENILNLAKFAAWIAVLLVFISLFDQWSIYSAKRDREAEKQSVGMSATMTGSMWSAAYRACIRIGNPDVYRCAANKGLLLQDTVAKQLAEIAIENRMSYEKICTKYYANEFCFDLLNRAFLISQQTQ